MKIVHGNVYVHKSNLDELKSSDRNRVEQALKLLNPAFDWNMVRIIKDRSRVTFSSYPDFDTDPHPSLKKYVSINPETKEIKFGAPKNNPVILHRKETFIAKSDPKYELYKNLTLQEVEAGLYPKDLLNYIGRRDFWDAFLIKKGLKIVNHVLQKIS